MEARSEKERYITNPLRLIHALTDLALRSAQAVDDNLYEFDDHRPYNETNYPPCGPVDGPYATEEELMGD